jgi:hypothetical protein
VSFMSKNQLIRIVCNADAPLSVRLDAQNLLSQLAK